MGLLIIDHQAHLELPQPVVANVVITNVVITSVAMMGCNYVTYVCIIPAVDSFRNLDVNKMPSSMAGTDIKYRGA